MTDGPPTRAEVCAAAIADCFAHDGEILANPIGTLPVIGGRLAKATVAPELVMTDGEALLVENIIPVGVDEPGEGRRGLEPVPHDVRRRVVGAPARDDEREPDRQVRQPELRVHRLVRRAAYAAARDARRAGQHDQRQDVVLDPCAHDPHVRARRRRRQRRRLRPRRASSKPDGGRFHDIHRVVTNLCVLDFETPDHRMRLRSVHPGVTVDDVVAATGFELAIDADVPTSRLPTDDELDVDPRAHRPERPRRGRGPEPVTAPGALAHADLRPVPASTSRSCRPAWAGSPARGS